MTREAVTMFDQLFGSGQQPGKYFCPGRVNLIGEHIDYLGGSVMPVAISLGITGHIRRNTDHRVRIHSSSFKDQVTFELDNLPPKRQKHWSDHALGVIHLLKERGIQISGFDLTVDSTLPDGSGLSSSAAIEVLVYFMLHTEFAGSQPDRTQTAIDCQRIENEFIGVNCGIMDQFIVAHGKEDCALNLDCSNLKFRYIPFELGDHSLVIINSKKPRVLADGAYNKRIQECTTALQLIQQHRKLDQLVDATEADLQFIPDATLRKRTRHAFSEQRRVVSSVEALSAGDLCAFGKLMAESHTSLRHDYSVSCTELDTIVDFLSEQPECLGARITGAGFGGCAIALIETRSIPLISDQLVKRYSALYGISPEIYTCQPSNGVRRVTND